MAYGPNSGRRSKMRQPKPPGRYQLTSKVLQKLAMDSSGGLYVESPSGFCTLGDEGILCTSVAGAMAV